MKKSNVIYDWKQTSEIRTLEYTCGYCGASVGPNKGFTSKLFIGNTEQNENPLILICPKCTKPTFFDRKNKQYPSIRLGKEVEGITDDDVNALYNEARDCTSLGANTASVLLCRKILMNIAVDKGADKGLNFAQYVDHLCDNNYVPPGGKEWVDKIRTFGNEATHKIVQKSESEAYMILHFVEFLLRHIYELPSMLRADEGRGSDAK